MTDKIEQPPEIFLADLEIKGPIRKIIDEEARRAKITAQDILGKSMSRKITPVRQFAMWRARKETGKTPGEIGRAFRRDRTTVIHAIEKIEREQGAKGDDGK